MNSVCNQTGRLHTEIECGWVCLTNKHCKPATVKVYDGRRTGDLPLSDKEVVAALVKSKQERFHLLFPDVQQQSDSSSCGLFSLAYAQTLCEE